MTTPTPADAIRAAIGALRHATDEEIAATVLRVAAAELLPRPAIDDRSPQADRDRLLRLQFLTPASELAGNPIPAESREALADAREESQAAAWDGIEPEHVLPAVEALTRSVVGAETIAPGPYSEHDLRQMWNAQSDEEWHELMSYQQLAFAQTQAIEADRRRRADPTPPTMAPGDLAQWLEDHAIHLQRMEEIGALPESELAPMLADAAALIRQHEANLTTTREADRRRDEPAPARLRHCPTHGQQGPEAWGCPECLRELRAELATAREALRRLVCWAGSAVSKGVNSEVVLAVADWFAAGMTTPLPPLPPQIAIREATIEPAPSSSVLPPALVHDGGDRVQIKATNHERTSWAVRDDLCCLNTNGEWEIEPCPSDRSADFLARTRWPSAAAAWEALQRSRAAEGVEG